MDSKAFLFLGLLLASAFVFSCATEVQQATDVNKESGEKVDPAYCKRRYCCMQGPYGCRRYCCRGSQAEADDAHNTVDQQAVKESEESNEIDTSYHRGGGGGGKGGGGGGHGGGGQGGYGGGGGHGGGGHGGGGRGGGGHGGGGRGGGGHGGGGRGGGGGGGGGKGGNTGDAAKP